MSSWPLLVVGICLAEVALVAGLFDFRSNCVVTHRHNKFASVVCDRDKGDIREKDLIIDSPLTTSIDDLHLESFDNIKIINSAGIKRLSIRNTHNATVYTDIPLLNELIVDGVDELTIKYKTNLKGNVEKLENISLTNINKLRLDNNEDIMVWLVESMTLDNIGDIDLESLSLNISATNAAILKCHVRVTGRHMLKLKASSVHVNESTLYVHDSGSLIVTANNFFIDASNIYIQNGNIVLLNSRRVAFSKNSFYDFHRNSVQIFGTPDVEFVKNYIFTSDLVNVLATAGENYRFTNNWFQCDSCTTGNLNANYFRYVGDTNYCYVACNLTLNMFRELLTSSSVCDKTSLIMDSSALCAKDGARINLEPHDSSPLINFNIFRIFLFIIIPLLLIASLLFWIYQKKKIINSYESARSILPQELECQRRNGDINETHSSHLDDDDSIYEVVESNYSK